MAKNKGKKPVKRRKSKRMDLLDYIALIIFIAIGIGIVVGAVWYYLFHLPAAEEEMTEVSVEFTYAFFDFELGEFSGDDVVALMSQERGRLFQQVLPGVMEQYNENMVVSQVESEVEVDVLEKGYNSGKTRVVFWQTEEDIIRGERNLLVFYTYEFKREDGKWLVDRIVTPSRKELEDFRRERGVLEENEEENGEDNGENGSGD